MENKETNQIKNFPFNAVMLAARNWYSADKDESLVDFFIRLIRLDDNYYIYKGNANEAKTLCLVLLDKLAEEFRKRGRQCWWDSYTTYNEGIWRKEHLYGATNAEAHILFVFDVLMHIDPEEIEIIKPVYGKGYPRMKPVETGMTYAEMQRMADRIFDKKKETEENEND